MARPRRPDRTSIGAVQHEVARDMMVVRIGDMELEYVWAGDEKSDGRRLVFLHEGLGSAALWKGFPDAVTRATRTRALVYSRQGYGRSSVVRQPRTPDYMHREALEVLPRLLCELGIERPILIGHSDGASIALIHTASRPVTGLVLLAPHIFVEELSLASIRAARETYLATDLPQRMARHHSDPDATFWGWNGIWLSDAFRDWNIEDCLSRIHCPVLVIQGRQDEYGTVAQVDAIADQVAGPVETVLLDRCNHAPHLQQPARTLSAAAAFVSSLVPSATR